MLPTQISQRFANSKISPHKGKVVSGIVPEPVIAAQKRTTSGRKIGRHYRNQFSTSNLTYISRVPSSGYISRAHAYLWDEYIRAGSKGYTGLLKKSLEEWSISYECIPCKCAVDHGERWVGRMEGDETVGWTEPLSSTGSSGWGKASDWSGGRIQHADAEIIGWIHFGPSYRGYIFFSRAFVYYARAR